MLDTPLKNAVGVGISIALIARNLASVVAPVDIGNTLILMLLTTFETTIFSKVVPWGKLPPRTHRPLPVWTEEQGTVNCPIVAVMLTAYVLMTSYIK